MTSSLKSYILSRYEEGIHSSIAVFKRTRLKNCSFKNSSIFLQRCITHNVIPKFFREKPKINTTHGKNLAKNFEIDNVKEGLAHIKRLYHQNTEECKRQEAYLKKKLTPFDFEKIKTVTGKAYEKEI